MNKKGLLPKLRSFLPARGILIALGLLLFFSLGACEYATSTPSSETVMDEVQTVVAETVSAGESPSATPSPSPTASVTPSLILTSPTPTPIAQTRYWSYSTSLACNSSEFIKDVSIPDGTILAPGETFIKTWKFKNIGSCTWQDDYLIVFVNGDEMDGETTYLDTTVSANKRGEASVVLIAPDEEGTYYAYWQLADEYGYAFGDLVYVEIIVSEDETNTPTPTPTATLTPTASATPTPTPTSTCLETETETPTPTSTPVPTEEPTEESTEVPTEESTPESVETATQ